MNHPRRFREVLPEALQEVDRLKPGTKVEGIRIRLKRSDPRVQNLLKIVEEVAQEIQRPSGIVEQRIAIEGAEARVIDALRACGLPMDDLLKRAGLKGSDPMASIRAGMGFLSAFASALDPKARDAIKVVQEHIQAAAENDPPK